jgi:hypothetical protein
MSRIGGPSAPTTARTPSTTGTADTTSTGASDQAKSTQSAPATQTDASGPPDATKHPPIDGSAEPTTTATAQTASAARARAAADPAAAQRQQALNPAHAHGHGHQHTARGHGDGSPVVTGGISGPQSARTFSTVEEARTALQNDYGVNARNGDASWTAAELTQAHQSFARMNDAERANLRGTDLVRDHRPSAAMQAEHNHDGEHGQLAGYYSPNVSTTNGQRDRPAAIHMFDSAFPTGGTPAENRAATQNIFLHEAGHAVEGQARNNAMADANAAVDRHRAALGPANDANDARNALLDDYNAAGRGMGQVRVPRNDRAWRNYARSTQTLNNRQQALYDAPNERARARAQTRLDQAISARDTAFAALPEDHVGRDAATEMNTQQDAMAAATSSYATAHVAEQQARTEMNTANTALGRLQNGDGVSSNQQAFNRMRAGSSETAPSAYGRSSPAEDYAESYALFRRDPTHMQEHYPNTYRWFNEGNHTP